MGRLEKNNYNNEIKEWNPNTRELTFVYPDSELKPIDDFKDIQIFVNGFNIEPSLLNTQTEYITPTELDVNLGNSLPNAEIIIKINGVTGQMDYRTEINNNYDFVLDDQLLANIEDVDGQIFFDKFGNPKTRLELHYQNGENESISYYKLPAKESKLTSGEQIPMTGSGDTEEKKMDNILKNLKTLRDGGATELDMRTPLLNNRAGGQGGTAADQILVASGSEWDINEDVKVMEGSMIRNIIRDTDETYWIIDLNTTDSSFANSGGTDNTVDIGNSINQSGNAIS